MKKGKEIYPKTRRVKIDGDTVQLTEKLDGSNLVIFKKNDELWFAQRRTIFGLSELEEAKKLCYSGLYSWIENYGQELRDNLNEGSAVCGEWLGMGNIKYDVNIFPKRFYIFAKANVDDDFNLYNLIYNHDLFMYPFVDKTIPEFIGVVPVVCEMKELPNKNKLDVIYADYCERVGGRAVEGFVINYQNNICKYVRMKSGKLVEYSDSDRKNS